MTNTSWLLEDGTPPKTDPEMSTSLGMRSTVVSTVKPILRASLPREGIGNDLEVFSGTSQTVMGSWMKGAPRKTDREVSTFLGKNLAADLSLELMMRVDNPWRSSLAHDMHF